MDLTRTALTVAVALYTVGCVYCQTNRQIDLAAKQLQVKVILTTNHNISGTHGVQIVLNNTGPNPILNTPGWGIKFEIKSDLFQAGATSYSAHGLTVNRDKGCSYVIVPTNTFSGLKSGQYVAFTIPGRGLMMFKSDVYPNLIVFKQSGSYAKTIESTMSDSLDFVYINVVNTTVTDMSQISGIARSIKTPDVYDEAGVPGSTIIPAAKSIQMDLENLEIIQLNDSAKWYVWADQYVSTIFRDRLISTLSQLPDMAGKFVVFTPNATNPQPPTNSSVAYILKKPKTGATKDYYRLAVGNTRGADFIHITAASDEGFSNALASIQSVLGLFVVMPHLTIEDDARFESRSVMLDVTKNFFPPTTIVKLLNLMSRYKLNNLVLVLGDDFGWRLQMPNSMNFAELTTFASKRCADDTSCLHPDFGAGATPTTSASGFYTIDEFVEIIKQARNLSITVTPRFNLMGGLTSAKEAAHKRFMRLKDTNMTEADRLHIMTPNHPNLTPAQRPVDTCYIYGLLNPCAAETTNFVNDLILALRTIYQQNGVPLTEFHAGGDEMTKYLNNFPNCNNAQRRMMTLIQSRLADYTRLRVSQEAVTDYSTDTCLTGSGTYVPNSIVVDFWDIQPTDHRNWGLNVGQWAYLNDFISPPVNDTGTDPLKPYTHQSLGDAPWSLAYKCANMDYKVIIGPKSFFALDNPYEIDFNEIGNRQKYAAFETPLTQIMPFEFLNLDANMVMGPDRFRFPPYRLCKMFNCVSLQANKRANIIGAQASIDTSVIRNEPTLWHMLTPRLLLVAEKFWREAAFENILDPRDTQALINNTLVRYRAGALEAEMAAFINTLSYKELGILDAMNVTYRVTRPGVTILNGATLRQVPPYPIAIKLDLAGSFGVEYRELHTTDKSWKPLFQRNQYGQLTGGYAMQVPFATPPPTLDIRVKSADGNRAGLPTRVVGSPEFMFPREIPPDLRNGTCLPINNYLMTRLEDVTPAQWTRIFANIYAVAQDDIVFMQNRNTQLESVFTNYQRSNTNTTTRALAMPQVFQGIEILMANGIDMTTRAVNDIYQHMFRADQTIMANRQRQLQTRLQQLENQYQTCSAASASNAAG